MRYDPPANAPPATSLRTLTFRTAVMVMTPDATVSVFADARTNHMWLSAVDTPEYREIASWAGYGEDWRRYNREHDATHHWLADWRGWQWSPALHDPEPVAIGEASQAHQDEEHLVNRLQRMVRTGAPDEYGLMERLFGDRLGEALGSLRALYGRIG